MLSNAILYGVIGIWALVYCYIAWITGGPLLAIYRCANLWSHDREFRRWSVINVVAYATIVAVAFI